ncbi:hypothetical protein FRB96_006333 [Tulasnella sp. 330]|nr:hypothetical protein FRB96_006333 [Tulasnella sp. 330]
MDSKLYHLKASGASTHAVWDTLVFRKVQAVLGGRVVFISSGSAPISPDVLDFLKVAFACEGNTEEEGSSDPIPTLLLIANSSDLVAEGWGMSFICEIKLVDLPEFCYRVTDSPNPRGEAVLDEKSTEAAFDSDGWFRTGDVGEVDKAGRFNIIDRVKNIMKLSQGEYVALEKVTNDYLIGIVVPDPVALSDISTIKFDPTSGPAVAAAIRDPLVVKTALEVMTAHAKASGLKGFETVKDIHFTLDQFTVENNTLTPTFKIQRHALGMYKEVIDEMYAKDTAV